MAGSLHADQDNAIGVEGMLALARAIEAKATFRVRHLNVLDNRCAASAPKEAC